MTKLGSNQFSAAALIESRLHDKHEFQGPSRQIALLHSMTAPRVGCYDTAPPTQLQQRIHMSRAVRQEPLLHALADVRERKAKRDHFP